MEDIVIYGASGFGKEVLYLIEQINNKLPRWNVLGFVDRDYKKIKNIHEYLVLGDISWFNNLSHPVNVVVGIGDPNIRKTVVDELRLNKNIIFPSLISNDLKLSQYVSIGEGCIITAGVKITIDISIGNYVVINLNSTIGHDSIICDFVTINPGSNISGNTYIGYCSFIGTGSKIIEKKNIGNNVIVGAGSVIIQDIPDNKVVVGVPGKVIKDIQ